MQKILTILLISLLAEKSYSQLTDSTKTNFSVNGAITVTNSGISVIPTFTLGKPAAIFDFILRKKNFSFEPQFRFAIEDFKPWSYIFWMRYKITNGKKFKMGIGVHPSTVFANSVITENGVSKEIITVRRYWAGDLNPTIILSKNVSLGIYYLYARGLGEAAKNTNFVALNTNFSNITLTNNLILKASPQLYYLNIAQNDGYYFTSTFILERKNFPVTLSSIINKKIESNIPSEDFVWNMSLTYAF